MRREQIARGIGGALLLARFDARGMQLFDLSADGFWDSFFGAVLVAPVAIYWLVVGFPETTASTAWVITVEVIRYLVGWVLFPAVMIPIARGLRVSANYVPFVIAYNWSMVVQTILFFVITVIGQTGLIPLEVYTIAYLAAVLYTIVYLVFIARTALGVSGFIATILSLLDFALTYLLVLESQRLL